jgi:two-component sensor histidine kinase
MLVLAVFLPAMLMAALMLLSMARNAYATQQEQLNATASALSLAVSGEIDRMAGLAQALAASPSLARRDWRALDAQGRVALRDSLSWVVVRDPEGLQLVNTRRQLDGPPRRTRDQDLGVTWSGVRGEIMASNLFRADSYDTAVVVVRKRVRLPDGGEVDVNVMTPARALSRLVAEQRLPDRWTATILDGDGRVIARNRRAEDFIGRLATPDVLARLDKSPAAVMQSTSLEGTKNHLAYNRVEGYGWTALVAMPSDQMSGAAREPVVIGVIMGTLLLSGGLLMAFSMARRIARPVEGLSGMAADWVSGRPVSPPPHSGLPEADRLAEAFSAAVAAVEERDARQKLLINELNHRVKNTLATVQAVASHSRRGASTVAEFHDALEGRLHAMGRAHELLTRTSWEGAELSELSREALRPFADPRLHIAGPPIRVQPTDALNLTLILHELATNAAKYGALSVADGRADLSWRKVGEAVRIDWIERGGPPVVAPQRRGFGSRLIERAAQDMRPAALDFEAQGVRCMLTIRPRR